MPLVILAYAALLVALYRHLRARRDGPALWRSSTAIGSSVGVARAALASVGWYAVEHSGGPLQPTAFALAMLAWPEAALLGRHHGPAQPGFYIGLGLLLVASSLLVASAVALMAARSQRARVAQRRPAS